MRHKLSILLLLATALAVLAVGCGGGGDDGSSSSEGSVTTSSLSKAKFIKQVNAICEQRREERYDEITSYVEDNEEGDGEASKDVLAEAVRAVFAPSLTDEVAEIRELGAPRGDEGKIEGILTNFQNAADAAGELEDIAAKAVVDREYVRGGKLARAYGLEECLVG